MQNFLRTVGIGLGAVVAFILVCYVIASVSIKLCDPLRDVYEEELIPGENEILSRVLLGLTELLTFSFCIVALYLLGWIIL